MSDPADPLHAPTRLDLSSARPPAEGETIGFPPATPDAGATYTHAPDGPPPADGPPPDLALPGFAVARELGRGGMGVVYEARQEKLGRPVALKVLRGRASPQDVIRFLNEAAAVAAIRHPNVVQVYEYDQHGGTPYMALELLPGGTLAERITRNGKFDPRAAAELVAQLAGAVQAAHDLGIVHRDLKPSNVLFDAAGAPKVTDFGLAKKGDGDLTRTQAVMGTPAYMAPEQARGDAKFVGPAADVWALGAVLYECLTGARPFDADDTWAILRKVTDEPPSRPRVLVPDLPRDLERVVLKCLEKAPADRYPSAAALAADLGNFLAGRPVSVRPAGPGERFVKWVRRNPGLAGATAAVALALVAGAAVSAAFAVQAARRGNELSQSNADLTRTNDDLTAARDAQEQANRVLRESQEKLQKTTFYLIQASDDVRKQAYLSQIALAHQFWKSNDPAGARAALNRCPMPQRSWEWHYLDRLTRPDRPPVTIESLPRALAYSPDGNLLAVATLTGKLAVYDRAGKVVHSYDCGGGGLGDLGDHCLAFRPDGTELAFASEKGVWAMNLTTGAVETVVAAKRDTGVRVQPKGEGLPSGRFTALGYDRAGTLVAAFALGEETPAAKRRFQIRDVRRGAVLAALDGWQVPRGVVVSVTGTAFSSDGTRFAAIARDTGVRTSSEREQAEPTVGPADPAPKKGGEKRPADPKDAPKKPPAPKDEPPGAFAPVLYVWDVGTGKVLLTRPAGGHQFETVAFGPDGAVVCGGAGRGVVYARDEVEGWSLDERTELAGHPGEVLGGAFDPANGLVWSGGEGKVVLAHERSTEREPRLALQGCDRTVLKLAVSPDGRELAAVTGDIFGDGGTLHRFDLAARRADGWRSAAPRDRINFVAALAPDGSRFAAVEVAQNKVNQTRLEVRELATGRARVTDSDKGELFVTLLPGGRMIGANAVRGAKGPRLLDADGNLACELSVPAGASDFLMPVFGGTADARTVLAALPSAAPGDDRGHIAALRAGFQIVAWDVPDPKPRVLARVERAQLPGPAPGGGEMLGVFPTGLATDPQGRFVAAAVTVMWVDEKRGRIESRGGAFVYELATGKLVLSKITPEALRAVTFDTFGRLVAGGGGTAGGAVYGWDVGTGAEAYVLRGHTRPVMALAFGPDGRLATGSADRTVKVWDTAARRELLTFDGFRREVMHVAFTPQGELACATGADLLLLMSLSGAGMPSEWPAAEVRVFRACPRP